MLYGDILILIGVLCSAISLYFRTYRRERLSETQKLITIALFIFSIFLTPYGFTIRSAELSKMSGIIETIDIDYDKPIIINFGSNHFIITIDKKTESIDLSRFINYGYSYPITIHFEDDKILIDAEILNKNGDIIAKIVNNEWRVNEDNMIAWDRNYNNYAFEVINSDQIPVIQILIEGSNKIYLGGYYYYPEGSVLATLNGVIINPTNTTLSDYIAPLFKYPSSAYLHELSASN